MKRLALLLCALGLTQLCCPVAAATISYVDTIPFSTTDWTKSVTITKFNPALGTLQSIDFSLTGYLHSAVKFESLDAAPSVVTTTLSGTITLKRPDLSTITSVLPFTQQNVNVSAFDGVIDFGGTSGATLPNVNAQAISTATSPPPIGDLALFSGVGTIILPVTASALAAASGPGNLIYQADTKASATVKVTYTFKPNYERKKKLYQAYKGSSNGVNVQQAGYGFSPVDVITSVPGVFRIVPGPQWSNFVAAAQAGVSYSVKRVELVKEEPMAVECPDFFPGKIVTQVGTQKIRLTWPLLFEPAGTKWTLTIVYRTPTLFDDDGPGPNPPSYAHTETWEWEVGIDFDSLKDLLEMFHELPFGLNQVPLIANDDLYAALQAQLDLVIADVAAGDMEKAMEDLFEFEAMISEALITDDLPSPDPVVGTGVVSNYCYPAGCKLLFDAEMAGIGAGIFVPAK